jgi:hypothetical protein
MSGLGKQYSKWDHFDDEVAYLPSLSDMFLASLIPSPPPPSPSLLQGQ